MNRTSRLALMGGSTLLAGAMLAPPAQAAHLVDAVSFSGTAVAYDQTFTGSGVASPFPYADCSFEGSGGTSITCLDATSFSRTASTVSVAGTAMIDGAKRPYTIDIQYQTKPYTFTVKVANRTITGTATQVY